MAAGSTLASVTIRRLVLPPGAVGPDLGDAIRDSIVEQLERTEATAASPDVARSIARSIVRHPSLGEAGVLCPARGTGR